MIKAITLLLFTTAATAQITKHQIGDLTVEVYLPPKYSETESYPVIYSNDGEWLFGENSWQIDQKLNEWIKTKRIDPVILVAIFNNGARESKYLPYYDPTIGSYQALAKEYTDEIVDTLIPFIDSNYAASDSRGIMGASFGGLHSTWAGLNYPETFSFIIAQSPSYWVNNFEIHNLKVESTDQIVWIDIGTKDWDDVLSMYYHLSLQGFEPCKNLFYYEDYNGRHDGNSWSERLMYPLILFTKGVESEIIKFDAQAEYILSFQNPGLVFSRINPVATFKNGVKHTPFPYVQFTSKTGNIEISPYGGFKMHKKENDELTIEFEGKKIVEKIRWKDNPLNR